MLVERIPPLMGENRAHGALKRWSGRGKIRSEQFNRDLGCLLLLVNDAVPAEGPARPNRPPVAKPVMVTRFTVPAVVCRSTRDRPQPLAKITFSA